MTPEEAKQALETQNAAGLAENTVGFWCYVIKPADGQWGGKVLHFWPIRTMREKSYPFYPEFSSVCDLDTEKGEWQLPTDDLFYRGRLPRCKRCVKRLKELANGTT